MKSSDGSFELDVPRDRNGSFEPEIVKKHQTTMSDEIEKKILSLYALGNSYSQISKHIEDIYCVGFSKAAISAVTDQIIPMLESWKIRPLEAIYPFVFLHITAHPATNRAEHPATWREIFSVFGF